ncbi:hypothetical protein [Neorhodopirellula pilleata]|uniref:hypothetical protein n=1 Tax=Neorhodopirellula pilleata TaxID=2714738 RepID=UPI0011B478E9|nr:hypothetical protein [Neorhodopirellula pilleata]
MALPIFVVPQNGFRLSSEINSRLSSDENAVAVSVLAVPVFFFVFLLQSKGRFPRLLIEDWLLIAYAGLMLVSFVCGMFATGSNKVAVATMLFLQTVFPLLSYASVRLLGESAYRQGTAAKFGENFWWTGSVVLSISAVAYFLQTAIDGGAPTRHNLLTNHIGPFYNPKALRFYPIAYSCFCVAMIARALVIAGSGRLGSLLMSLILLAAIGASHSRTAILTVAIGSALVVTSRFSLSRRNENTRLRLDRRSLPVLLVLLGGFFGGLIAVRDSRSVDRLVETVNTLLEGSQLDEGDTNRGERLKEGLAVAMQPLGSMFQPSVRSRGNVRVVNAESGIVDAAVRGGPIAFLIVGLLSCRFAIRMLMLLNGRPSIQSKYWSVLASAVICSTIFCFANIWINVLTEPFFAQIAWASAGIVVSQLHAASINQQP